MASNRAALVWKPQPGRQERRTIAFPRRLTGLIGRLWHRPSRPSPPPPSATAFDAPELDCLRGVLAPEALQAAARRSSAIGVGADQVLIQCGAIDEDAYLHHLAAHCGIRIETFSALRREDCPLSDAQLHYAGRYGLVPVLREGRHDYIQILVGLSARRISELALKYPAACAQLRLASRRDFDRFVTRHAGSAIAQEAAEGLSSRWPELSAAPAAVTRLRRPVRRAAWTLAWAAIFTLMPLLAIQLAGAALAVWFLLFNGLRLAGSFAPRTKEPQRRRLSDDCLPVYTVMVALYHEATSVAPLLRALEALDYPREKLDIKLVIEPDDTATREAIAALGPLPHVHVITAPDFGPRTKPKALNYALAFARGTFLAVFDAEDRPDPGQLRSALDVFSVGEKEIACAQASLCIDNSADSWLTRMFTAEYAGQFDVFLQGFSAFRMPLPLGGSSNHFRTALLREVGGWDAYNVTEDADLGFRLARFGYRSVMFAFTTYEEAPARLKAWLRQRSRWMKGWMQTWLVHMRAPRELWRDAGPSGFFTLNIIVGGNVLTALAHPLMLAEILIPMTLRAFDSTVATFLASEFAGLHVATIATGYLSTVLIGLIGLSRRGLLRHAWVLALTPLYWVLLSLAAWRALIQLMHDPYRWEKTEHGLARHSRLRSHRPQRRRATGEMTPAMARQR
ncbi:MAG: glycosyltransferase [Rhizobiales bacterium]|nr:glycosyltransferase [Hyphomicrobiales bacterium]